MSLDLGLIGNGTVASLVDGAGDIVWGCFPRLDGDPAFCSLLGGAGRFAIELVRTNPRTLGPLTTSQGIALGCIAVGALALRRARPRLAAS